MTNPLQEMAAKISRLEALIKNQQNQEPSKIVPLVDHIRVLDDNVARAAVYGPNNVAVGGVTGLPAVGAITGVWWQAFIIGNSAANVFQLTVRCPDAIALAPVRIAGKLVAVGDQITGAGFVRLGIPGGAAPGNLSFTMNSGTYSRLVIDVVAYQV